MKIHRRVKTITAWGQLFVGVVALIFVFFAYRTEPANGDLKASIEHIFYTVFFLYASGLVVDRIGDIARTLAHEKDEDEFRGKLDELPSLFAGRNDVVTFPNHLTGIRYCISAVEDAVNVNNTVLRFGISSSHSPKDDAYVEYLSAKRRSIESNVCSWIEILSKGLGEEDDAMTLARNISAYGARYYSYRTLDDCSTPMVQMTIFEYKSGYKEILFGWEFPGHQNGASILTRNEKIISFFDNYFDHFWSIASLPSCSKGVISVPEVDGSLEHNS